MIANEIDELIKEFLADGFISEKERQVLLKKAQLMGLDTDEVSLYIDAQQQKADNAKQAITNKRHGRSCPFCGAYVPLLTDKCPECNHILTVEASEDFQDIVDNLEEALVELKAGKSVATGKAKVERYARKARLYYGNNPKVQNLLEEIEEESNHAEANNRRQLRKETLKNFVKKVTKSVFSAIWSFIYRHPWWTVLIAFLLFCFCYSIVEDSQLRIQQQERDKKYEQFAEAIASGDLNQAIVLAESRDQRVSVAEKYLEEGNVDKAFRIVGTGHDAIHALIEDHYISQGEYSKAIGVLDRPHYYVEEFYTLLCKCVDHMLNNNDKNSIKRFIDGNVTYFPNDEAETYKKRLYEYAGLH